MIVPAAFVTSNTGRVDIIRSGSFAWTYDAHDIVESHRLDLNCIQLMAPLLHGKDMPARSQEDIDQAPDHNANQAVNSKVSNPDRPAGASIFRIASTQSFEAVDLFAVRHAAIRPSTVLPHTPAIRVLHAIIASFNSSREACTLDAISTARNRTGN
jgi:hypothetical protein